MSHTGKEYWRSLDQLADTPQFREWVHREFSEGASEMLDGSSRRTLLKLMAASFGLAGLTACRRPVENILPAAMNVEDYIPGRPLYYATATSVSGAATGLIVETHDGRPTKVEGNPSHPFSLGACSAHAQASVLNLYDPDRSKTVLREGAKSSWEEFTKFAKEHFASLGQGEGLRFLAEPSSSPSLAAVKAHALAKFPRAKWVEYESVNQDNVLEGSQIAFGQPVHTHYRFDNAEVVLALDADFLGLDSQTILPVKQFAQKRRVGSTNDVMNRLYVVEAQFSLTGAMADHRLRMRASDVARLAFNLASELNAAGDGLRVLQNDGSPARKWLAAVAKDLANNRGKSLVVAGPRQPAVVHAAVHLINQALGNAGQTVTYTRAYSDTYQPQVAGIKALAEEMASGQVKSLVILGGNPVYTAPADLDFATNLKKVDVSIHLGSHDDETAAVSKWHLPEAHYLETWGDVRALDGTVSIQQPMIQPLYEGKSAVELLALVSGYKDQRGYDIVRNQWLPQMPGPDREMAWRRALHDGIAATAPKLAEVRPSADARKVAALAAEAAGKSSQGVEIVFYPSSGPYDGRYSNNGWLQEAPDPMTKLVWDNAALMSAPTAKSLGVEDGDLIAISNGGREVPMPVMVQPGHADDSISLALGYGRTRCGRVGEGVGHNAGLVRTSEGFSFASGATVRKLGQKYQLVTTQNHHSMEGRPIVREATLTQYREHPTFAPEAVEHPPLFSLFKEHEYTTGNQWGMVIDLNTCVGCNACLVACQAENNIPIVGKYQVSRGREMHWIRLDRYYTGSVEDPQAVVQPLNCMQCENAPCETVCPVAATTHSPEGLNDMAYNRCVGTRYCANNCPFKVRRFNFLNWHTDVQESKKLVHNPDVTVRMRGVMEKCTYCVQRIQEKKILAKTEGRRPIRDGEILTACQQTCPADAIVFGNINDPQSKVSRLKAQDKNYVMLPELNIKPRTSYTAKLRNPNPELA